MPICTIPGCGRIAVAGGLCPMHYMRQRRHGDPNVEFPPGRPPQPKPANPELDALRRANAALRNQVATLTRERDAAQAASPQPGKSDDNSIKLIVARNIVLERENAALKDKLAKVEASPDE